MDHWWAKELPRLFEIYSESQQDHADNYFRDFHRKLRLSNALEAFKKLEDGLNELNKPAWQAFKRKVLPFVCKKHPLHNYQQLVDCFNEVKGYLYLKREGFTDIQFIPEDKLSTPDLRANGKRGIVLLEVKTLNHSDEGHKNTRNRQVREAQKSLPVGFINSKLDPVITNARQQLLSIKNGNIALRIVYLIIKLDMDCAVCLSNYEELASLINERNVRYSEIEIEYECTWV